MLPEWEIWLDSNISPIIAKWMADEFNLSVKSSYSLNFNYKTDQEIYHLAKAAGNIIIISKDADFPELITRLGTPPKLINIKIGNCDNRYLWHILKTKFPELLATLSSGEVDIIDLE